MTNKPEYTPTSGEKYDFVNHELKKIEVVGESKLVVMNGRVYTVVFEGTEEEYFNETNTITDLGVEA